ncbi:glycosyltransferase family 2 protein [Actinopolymorpha sp. B17G11]|uniref:glycosyltransferase family 2 protein n=1 Tax=Actinopolymorpha sp. B17G11 TaxID=3160861 RepID=UPI0032E3CEA5
MGVKVSVIVPVYNPGPRLDSCLASLLGQSLSAGEYEVLFIDTGSADGTLQRLDTLAEKHPHIRVIHAAHTGGPGRPRNVGIEVASGEYLYFLTAHDRLASPALERMYAMAIRSSADIVVGKVVGYGANEVPRAVFLESRDNADILAGDLFRLMTPHKLFRTGFLLRHRLRFAEGPAWLADERFVAEAYFLAKVTGVLSDGVCCHWGTPDRPSEQPPQRRLDPTAYTRSLRQLLDLVDTHTDPGDERDQIYARFYQDLLLGPLGSPRSPGPFGLPGLHGGRSLRGRLVRQSPYALFREVRHLAAERFSTGVERALPPSIRVRARLLHAGAYAEITKLAGAERGLTVVPTLDRVDWDGNALVIRASAQLTYADGRPVTFRRVDGRLLWEPPVSLKTKVPIDAYDVTKVLSDSRLDVYVQSRDDSGDFRLPTQCHLVPEVSDDTEQLVLQGTARLDVRTGRLGRPLDAGTWDCFVRVESCGWELWRRLTRPSLYQHTAPAPARTLGTGDQGPVVEPHWTALGGLSVRVQRSPTHRAAAE